MTSVVHLQFTATYAARFALGCGVDRETVAMVLEDEAAAIRNPLSIDSDMSPIMPDEF